MAPAGRETRQAAYKDVPLGAIPKGMTLMKFDLQRPGICSEASAPRSTPVPRDAFQQPSEPRRGVSSWAPSALFSEVSENPDAGLDVRLVFVYRGDSEMVPPPSSPQTGDTERRA